MSRLPSPVVVMTPSNAGVLLDLADITDANFTDAPIYGCVGCRLHPLLSDRAAGAGLTAISPGRADG